MALEDFQVSLSVSVLYEISHKGGVSGDGARLNPSIWANSEISIYGSDSATQPASLADMTLQSENVNVAGHLVFSKGISVIPRYIAITGAASEIIASGLELSDLGAIS